MGNETTRTIAAQIDVLETEEPIAEIARQFVQQVVPPNAPAIQTKIVLDAFWAGAAAIFGLVMATNAAADEDEAAMRLAALHRELGNHGAVIEVVEGPPERTRPTAGRPRVRES